MLHLLSLALAPAIVGLGDRLVQDFLKFNERPLLASEAVKLGWVRSSACTKGLGIGYTFGATSSAQNPTTLYYTAHGQIAGLSAEIYGPVQQALVTAGFVTAAKQPYVSVGFREGDVCDSDTQFDEPVGTVVVVNPATIAYSIPLSVTAATQADYHKGACFDAMGVHWMYDLNTAPKMSWNASSLLPVIPMYWPTTGKLATVLFASTSNESSYNAGWDLPAGLSNALMCANTCDKDCTFANTDVWSTMHIFFHDPKTLTCDRNKYTCLPVPPAPLPGVGCCEKH